MIIKSIHKLKGRGIRIVIDGTKFKQYNIPIGDTFISKQIGMEILRKLREGKLP